MRNRTQELIFIVNNGKGSPDRLPLLGHKARDREAACLEADYFVSANASHTYSFLNVENKRFWVKFTMKTQQGIKNLTDQEAEALVGKDRESHQRDLFDSIEKGDLPRWTMYVQIMNEEDANTYHIHPFDIT
jgi:catalase